jgi:Zn-dependent membrane protease YugP
VKQHFEASVIVKFMTTKTKALLGISLTSFLISSTGVLWGLFLPVGAIVFGQFMIFNSLGKESALFDEEQRLRRSLAEKNISAMEDAAHEEVILSSAAVRP